MPPATASLVWRRPAGVNVVIYRRGEERRGEEKTTPTGIALDREGEEGHAPRQLELRLIVKGKKATPTEIALDREGEEGHAPTGTALDREGEEDHANWNCA